MDGYLGDKLPVLKVYVGGRRNVVLPDAHPSLLGRPGMEQERREERRSREEEQTGMTSLMFAELLDYGLLSNTTTKN